MLKMGILGLLRLLSWTPDPPLWWAGLLTALGAASGVGALAFALGQRDMKRMLAYSSIENMGIVALGLGLALAGKSLGNPALVALGGAGALLHALNHALFKPLLFMGAGAVVHGSGTRDLERLGGLARTMPRTALLFLLGSAAICALPPLNGFAGEFLIYLGALGAITQGTWAWAIVPVGALALIGTLAVAAFTRTFGIAFLGEPRSADAQGAHEAPASMLAPMAALAGLCVLIGLVPLALRPALARAVAHLGPAAPLAGVAPLLPLTLLGALAILAALAGWTFIRRAPSRTSVTWDCGYQAPTPRIQYTATSFAQMLTDAFSYLLRPQARQPRVQGLFPRPSRFRTVFPDLFLDRGARPFFDRFADLLGRLRFLQGGHLPIYLLYVIITLVVLFAWTLA
jgi:hydrogenase-4 component B